MVFTKQRVYAFKTEQFYILLRIRLDSLQNSELSGEV